MKVKGSSYFYIVIMGVMLFVIATALMMEYFESKLLPLVIGGAVFILAAIGLSSEISARSRQETAITDREVSEKKETRENWHGYMANGGWVAGFCLVIYLLGFIIAIPLFILAYMKSHGTRWFVAITFAILLPTLIYSIFELALGINLYRGLLLTWLAQ